jgi:hypothetical protein
VAAAIVQQNRAASTATTQVATLGATPTAGNLLIAVVGYQVIASLVTLADGLGSSGWTQILGTTQGAGSCSTWAKVAVGSASEKTITASNGGSAVTGWIEALEISGADTTIAGAIPSQNKVGDGSGATVATFTHTAINPTGALSGVLISGIHWVSGVVVSPSVNTGMTAHVASTVRGAEADLVVAAAAASYAPAWSWTNTRTLAANLVYVQAAAGGAAADGQGMMAWFASRFA